MTQTNQNPPKLWNSTTPLVVIGFDEREADAYAVCKHSLLRTSKGNVTVLPLNHRFLRKMGWFTREWLVKSDGSYEDVLDGRPFSTQFSHSRFLTPYVANQMGYKGRYVVFVDCDFVFKRDINDLINYVDNHPKEHPVWCVKHDFSVKEDTKMDGQKQQDYPCKLWSSLMVFDLECVDYENLNHVTNCASGRKLHTFTWAGSSNIVGPLPEAWNFIPEHSEPRVRYEDICALHYTHGIPTMRDVSYSSDYYNVLKEVDKWDLIQPGRVGPF